MTFNFGAWLPHCGLVMCVMYEENISKNFFQHDFHLRYPIFTDSSCPTSFNKKEIAFICVHVLVLYIYNSRPLPSNIERKYVICCHYNQSRKNSERIGQGGHNFKSTMQTGIYFLSPTIGIEFRAGNEVSQWLEKAHQSVMIFVLVSQCPILCVLIVFNRPFVWCLK